MNAKLPALLVPALLVFWTGTAAAQRLDATQHFLLTGDGGVVSMEAANPEDPMTPDAIRTYLTGVTKAGFPELSGLGAEAKYTFEATPEGGRVFIRTQNSAALLEIHDYLRFQIRVLQTGDSVEIK